MKNFLNWEPGKKALWELTRILRAIENERMSPAGLQTAKVIFEKKYNVTLGIDNNPFALARNIKTILHINGGN